MGVVINHTNMRICYDRNGILAINWAMKCSRQETPVCVLPRLTFFRRMTVPLSKGATCMIVCAIFDVVEKILDGDIVLDVCLFHRGALGSAVWELTIISEAPCNLKTIVLSSITRACVCVCTYVQNGPLLVKVVNAINLHYSSSI